MNQVPNSSRLRYLDADKLDDSTVDFDGMDVYGWEHQKLGDLDGFVVNADTGRVYYAVIDSGGWFSSRQFLLPMGHLLHYDAGRRELHTDLAKERLRDLPEFDRDRFSRFTDEELNAFERKTRSACCPDVAVATTEAWSYDTEPHYREPGWWTSVQGRSAARAARSARQNDRPQPVRSGDEARRAPAPADVREREYARARGDEEPPTEGGEASPHLGGRAQPGDVIGVETGGERSHLGEDAGDENKRRRDAEREVSKRRDNE